MILLVGMGFFGVSFGLPVFFQGLGFGFVQGDFYIYQAVPPCMRLCVCLSWFKEIKGLHSVRRSGVVSCL